MTPRLRWSLRLATAVRRSAIAMGVGLLVLVVVTLLQDDTCATYEGSLDVVSWIGAAAFYGGVVAATACGLALVAIGWRQPGWSRRVLWWVPVTWATLLALWAVAIASCVTID